MKRHYSTPLFVVISIIVLILAPLSAQGMKEQPSEQRIVSLSPNVTETIMPSVATFWSAGAITVTIPRKRKRCPVSGRSTILRNDPFPEPTHAISSAFVPDELLAAVEQAHINVLSLHAQETFEGTYDLIRKIGDVIQKQSQAERLIGEMKAQVQAIEEKAATLPKVTCNGLISALIQRRQVIRSFMR